MKLTLAKRHHETADIETFLWQPETPIEFTPGQFLRWSLPHDNPDDRGTKRFFSIASSPTEDHIQLTTRFNPKGSSFKQALRALQPGATIEVGPPGGSFVLDNDPGDELILVAGGIGITPFRSMLKFLHDAKSFVPIHLVFGLRGPDDIVFGDLLQELEQAHPELHITYVLEQGKERFEERFGHSVESGRITAELLQSTCDKGDHNANKETYLSGPEPMIKALKEQLLEAGHDEQLIKTDYFPGYADR